MEEFQDTLTRCARLEVRKKAAFMREARLVAKHEYERKQLQLAQDSMYKVWIASCDVECGVVWYNMMWCGIIWCGVVWCGVVWCGVVWCGVVWCGVEFSVEWIV
jgi:hypothetical protein